MSRGWASVYGAPIADFSWDFRTYMGFKAGHLVT